MPTILSLHAVKPDKPQFTGKPYCVRRIENNSAQYYLEWNTSKNHDLFDLHHYELRIGDQTIKNLHPDQRNEIISLSAGKDVNVLLAAVSRCHVTSEYESMIIFTSTTDFQCNSPYQGYITAVWILIPLLLCTVVIFGITVTTLGCKLSHVKHQEDSTCNDTTKEQTKKSK